MNISVLKIKKYFLKRDNWPLVGVVVACLLFGLLFSVIALHRYWQYEAWYYDFGIFAQAIYSVSRFEVPIIDHFVVTNKIIFADHFHPFIFILAPLFWFTEKAEVILVAQAVMTGLSGIFIYLTAKTVTKNTFLSLCLLTIYFSFIGLHFAMVTEFHELGLLPLPLALFFYALVKKNVKLYIAATLMVLMVKESTFIIPAFFGFLEALKSKGSWRTLNLGMMMFCLLYGAVVVKLVIPYFAGGGYQYTTDSEFHLSSFPGLYDTPLKVRTMWQTLASYGFLPLLAPEMLVAVVVNWYSRFSLSSESRHGLVMHYNAEVAPTLLFASIYGVMRLRRFLKRDAIVFGIVTLATLWCLYFSFIKLDSPVRLAVLPDFYRHTQTFSFLNELVEKVPNEGSVMAQTNLAPRFIDQHVKMLRFNYEDFDPDWIVIDTRAGQNPNNFFGVEKPDELFVKLATDQNYDVYYQNGEQIIYGKKK